LAWSLMSVIALSAFHLIGGHAAQRLMRNGRLTKNIAIVGATEIAGPLAARFTKDGSGAHLAGILDSATSRTSSGLAGREIEHLEKLASEGRIDEVIVAIPPSDGNKIAELCRRFHPFAVALRILVPPGLEYFRVLESCRYGETRTFLVVRKPLDDVAGI